MEPWTQCPQQQPRVPLQTFPAGPHELEAIMAAVRVKSLPQYQKVRHIESGVWMPAWAAHKWQGQPPFLPAKWQLSINSLSKRSLCTIIVRCPHLKQGLETSQGTC